MELVGTSKHQHRTVKFLTQQQKSLSSLLSIIHFTYREEWNTKTLYCIPARSSLPGPPSIPLRSGSTERCNNRAPPQDTRHHRHRFGYVTFMYVREIFFALTIRQTTIGMYFPVFPRDACFWHVKLISKIRICLNSWLIHRWFSDYIAGILYYMSYDVC
jgi:hypothetical protein